MFQALTTIAKLDDKSLLEKALPLTFWNPYYFRHVHTMAQRYSYEWLYSRYVDLWNDPLPTTSTNDTRSLNTHSSLVKSFILRCNAIENISQLLPDVTWMMRQYKVAVRTLELSTAQDGVRLAKLASSWANEEYLNSM